MSHTIDFTLLNVDCGTKTITANSYVEFAESVTSIPDGSVIVEFTPYITGGSNVDGVVTATHAFYNSDTKRVNFVVRNLANASRTWHGYVRLRYVSPS